jgi:hypothetical protein
MAQEVFFRHGVERLAADVGDSGPLPLLVEHQISE